MCLLDTLVVMARDFVGVCCVAVGVGFATVVSSTVMQEIRFFRLLFASSVLATQLIACSIATSTSTSQYDFDSFFSKIFSFSLRKGVTFGSFTSLSFSSVSSSSSSSLLSLFFYFSILCFFLFWLVIFLGLSFYFLSCSSIFTCFYWSSILSFCKIKLLQQQVWKVCIFALRVQSKLVLLGF